MQPWKKLIERWERKRKKKINVKRGRNQIAEKVCEEKR
jgi:hypothetical protein